MERLWKFRIQNSIKFWILLAVNPHFKNKPKNLKNLEKTCLQNLNNLNEFSRPWSEDGGKLSFFLFLRKRSWLVHSLTQKNSRFQWQRNLIRQKKSWIQREFTKKIAMHLNPSTPPLACGTNFIVSCSGIGEVWEREVGGAGEGRRARALNRRRQAGARQEPGRSDDGKPKDRFPDLSLRLFLNKKQWSCSHTPTEGSAAVAFSTE